MLFHHKSEMVSPDAALPGRTDQTMPIPEAHFVLGTPLVTDIFHADRWDYVFTLKRQRSEPQSRKVTVFFKNDVVDAAFFPDGRFKSNFICAIGCGDPATRPPLAA